MSYHRPIRNYENVEHEKLRKLIAPKYDLLHDDLSEAYYDYWKQGKPKDFQGYDVKSKHKDNLNQYNKLHSLIHAKFEKEMYDENEAAAAKDHDAKLKEKYDHVKPDQIKSGIQKVQDKIIDIENESFEITVSQVSP